jgi:photosystem II stability/assembly factor-like uncharacterized protein
MNIQNNHTLFLSYCLTALVFMVSIALLVSGCVGPATVTIVPSATDQTDTTTPEPGSTATRSPTLTTTPSPTSTEATPSPTPVPVTHLRSIFDAGLVAEGQGWVISAGRLLWTPDGGDHWEDITPDHNKDLIITNVFCIDINHCWVAMVPQPQVEQVKLEIIVFYSQDGGKTWQQSSLEAALPFGMYSGITDLGFIDEQTGWLVVNQTASMNASAGDLYFTRDGGKTWQMSELPFNGPVNFINDDLGWMIGSCCTGAPRQLFRSENGGSTWEQQILAPNPVDDGFDYHDYQLPVFVNKEIGYVAVTYRDVFYETVEVGFYLTYDEGNTWQQITTFGPSELSDPGPGSAIQVQFLDAETWIAALGNAVCVTDESGESWEIFEIEELPGWHYRLMFVTEHIGWSLVFRDYCGDDCLVLYQTMDGGVTWAALGEDQ